MEIENILKPEEKRFSFLPIRYTDLYKAYKNHQSTLWIAEEIQTELSIDKRQWNTDVVSDEIKRSVKYILSFFAVSDGLVNDNLFANFMNEVQYMEAKSYYSVQAYIETVHNETYSLLLDTYIDDPVEKSALFDAVKTFPSIALKAKWIQKYTHNATPENFAERLIAFSIVEGVFFSGSFCFIFWLMEKNILPGLTKANEFISRDEGLHCMFAVKLIKDYIKNKPSEKLVHAMMKEAMDIEVLCNKECLQNGLMGMNYDQMFEYLKFTADGLLILLGYNTLYNATNPFPFMERQSIGIRITSFFESTSTDYSKANAGCTADDMKLAFDESFI